MRSCILKTIPKLNKIRNGKRLYYTPSIDEMKAFSDIKREIEKKYDLHLTSRDLIIKQLIETLTQGDHFTYIVPQIDLLIIRSDIKGFFPAINKHELYQRLASANILSQTTLDTLKPLFFSSSVKGVPLGLPFSSALAEVYLERFDRDIFTTFKPTFYFRYVDDIIILKYNGINKLDSNSELRLLEETFEKHLLLLNNEKTEVSLFRNNTNINFDYLGYHFNSITVNKRTSLNICISDQKLKKITNKIKEHFYLYKRSSRSKKQFWMLYYKLMNSLYGVTSVDKHNKKMRFGLGYTYRFINDDTQIIELVSIIKGLIFSCSLSSYKTSCLLHLISYDQTALELLNRRYDYTRLTNKQIGKIKQRLNLNTSSINISRIFYSLYSKV